MLRNNLVKEYNYYTRKREEYKAKLSVNSTLKGEIESKFNACMTHGQGIAGYYGFSNFFDELFEKNDERYSEAKKQEILDMLNALDLHINTQISIAQQNINYWEARIKAYDEEEERKQQGVVNEG